MEGHHTPHSAESKLKMSVAIKKNWAIGRYKNMINVTPESIEKGRNTQRKGSFIKCIVCGKSFYCSPITIKRGRKFCSKRCQGKYFTGSNHFNWKNKKRPYNHHQTADYKNWRKSVFERDEYTCQLCFKSACFIIPHHLLSYTDYPDSRYDIDNGMTLCEECHKLIHFGKEEDLRSIYYVRIY